MDKFYDYQIEMCLQQYELDYNFELEFTGGEQPEPRDPLQWTSSFWLSYGSKTNLTTEIVEEVEEEVVEETGSAKKQIEYKVPGYVAPQVTDQQVTDYLCEKVWMNLYSNPSDGEIVY
jgi:hypothetical protein